MAQLSTDALARASAVVGTTDKKPTTWHGAGAAEFDLRSMNQSRNGMKEMKLIWVRRYNDEAYTVDARSNLPNNSSG